MNPYQLDVDALAQEIRRVDGGHSLGAGALAEALAPYIAALTSQPSGEAQEGPEFHDGCSLDGFVGGCERMGCHPSADVPRINIKCEVVDNGIIGTTTLNVVRVDPEDDGSFTAVTDHWPSEVRNAADAPAELFAAKVGPYRITVADNAITISEGRKLVFSYDADAALAPVVQACKHKWRDSDRADPMLPCAWVQQCTKCGAYEDDKPQDAALAPKPEGEL